MRLYCATWKAPGHEGYKNLPEWFKNGEEVEVHFDQLKDLYERNYHVMITRAVLLKRAILMVDIPDKFRAFCQR